VVVLRPLRELAEPELEPADFAEPEWPVPEALDEPEAARAVAACAGPGSVYVTPAAVRTLAIPAAAVTARSLARALSRLATAEGSGVIGSPSASSARGSFICLTRSTVARRALNRFCSRCQLPQGYLARRAGKTW